MPRPPHSSRFFHPHNIGYTYNINKFKYELKNFLIENPFYSVEAYIDSDTKYDLGVCQ